MKVSFIFTGDELLCGAQTNTNLVFAGAELLAKGIKAVSSAEVPDNLDAIKSSVRRALETNDVVITCGGLGPTADDVTKEAVASLFNLRLEQSGEVLVNLRRYWKKKSPAPCSAPPEIPSRVLNQSLVPLGSKVLKNECGTAPGLIIERDEGAKVVILLPGPPSEFRPMFTNEVIPYLEKRGSSGIKSREFILCGIGETAAEDAVLPVLATHHPLSAAYCAHAGGVRLFLSSESDEVLQSAVRKVNDIFSSHVLREKVSSVEHEVVELLKENHASFATAESCTGGLVAKMITDVSGASEVFAGAIVSYSNEVKKNVLGVKSETLEKYGAVSRETALEMAEGVIKALSVDAAVSLTGIAGPGGGTPTKPVGLVYVGAAYRDRREVIELTLTGSREQIRARAAANALDCIRRLILSSSDGRKNA